MVEKIFIADKPTLDAIKSDTSEILTKFENNYSTIMYNDTTRVSGNEFKLVTEINGVGIGTFSATSTSSSTATSYLRIIVDDSEVPITKSGSQASIPVIENIFFSQNIKVYARTGSANHNCDVSITLAMK